MDGWMEVHVYMCTRFQCGMYTCEEVEIDDLLSDFSTDNTPVTTILTVDTLFESSSVVLNWTGNEYSTAL